MIQRRVKMLDSANRRMLWREAIRRATAPPPKERELVKDIWLSGRCLRVFYRGWKCSLRPYFFHRWGFYACGVLCVGFMFWPKENA